MSFTETNINELRDDVENKIANADKIAAWTIVSPSEQYVLPHSEVALDYVVQKNGIVVDEKPEISISGCSRVNSIGFLHLLKKSKMLDE